MAQGSNQEETSTAGPRLDGTSRISVLQLATRPSLAPGQAVVQVPALGVLVLEFLEPDDLVPGVLALDRTALSEACKPYHRKCMKVCSHRRSRLYSSPDLG